MDAKSEMIKAAEITVNAMVEAYSNLLKAGMDQKKLFDECRDLLAGDFGFAPRQAASLTRLILHQAAGEHTPYSPKDLETIARLAA